MTTNEARRSIELGGYIEVASAVCDLGTIRVVSDGAWSYFVVETTEDEPTRGTIVATVEYDTKRLSVAYAEALAKMAEIAVRWTNDPCDDDEE